MSDDPPARPKIVIRAETSFADPDTCRFTVDRTVFPGGPHFFDSEESAAGSPLIHQLFALDGVANVLVAESVVTVGKRPDARWDGLKARIGATIRTQLLSGVRAILEVPLETGGGSRDDAQLREVVQELLDREANPSIAAHGGKISIVDLREGRLYISMSGGCQGCAASQVTLRQGFEVMLRRVAPEIVEVVDTTDHSRGKSPFYQRTPA
jgi:Fe-S cluster biogenesis protein NfuA